MKRKLSFITAVLLAASMLATGCGKAEPSVSESVPSAPVTASGEVDEQTEAPASSEATETEITDGDILEAEESDILETTALLAAKSSVSSSLTALVGKTSGTAKTWEETEISEVMYIKRTCYSKSKPSGGKKLKVLKKGKKINVVAATDNGYYKLADGSYVYANYVSDEPVSTDVEIIETSASETTAAVSETTAAASKNSLVDPSYTKSYTERYAYKALSSSQKQLYRNIYNAVSTLSTTITVPDGLLTTDVLQVYLTVFNQEPQLFWMPREIPSGYGKLKLTYEYSADEIKEVQADINKNVNAILKSAEGKTTVAKLKVFYDWIIQNHDFSKSEGIHTCGILNGLIKDTELQCVGYSKTMLYLCDMSGIECMTVIGTNPEKLSHSWNVVYCDNGYYNIDATWGDPVNKHNSKYVRYNFFLVPDSWIADSHINVNLFFRGNGTSVKLFDPPACSKSSCNYFKIYNKEFDTLSSAKKALYAELDDALKNKKNLAEIRVTDSDIYNSLMSDTTAKEIQKYVQKNGALKISRQKLYNEGVLVVQYDIFY